MKRNLKRKEKNSFKRKLVSFFLGISAVLAIFFLASTNWKIYQKKAGLKDRLVELQGEAEEMEQKNIELNKTLAYVESEEYLDKVARDQLDLKKPGEEVIVIQRQVEAEDQQKQKDETWWERLKSIFTK